MDGFTLSSERSPWFQNYKTHRFGPAPQGWDIVIWMSLEIGKFGYPSCPSSKPKILFLHTSPILGKKKHVTKDPEKRWQKQQLQPIWVNFKKLHLSGTERSFGTVKLKVSRRSLYMLYIQIRLKLNHEDFHTQTLNVWYLYLQLVILLAK